LNKKKYKKDVSFDDYVEMVKDDLKIIPPQKWDSVGVARYINDLANYAQSSRTDGSTACGCKKELYLLKCFIENLLINCPTFNEEREWEQERLIDILKRTH